MTVRRMTFRQLAAASWGFWIWGAVFGMNVGLFIGELIVQRRWYLLALGMAGSICGWYVMCIEREKSARRIDTFYRNQLNGEAA